MQKSSRAAQLGPRGHGKYVYAYFNIRTNQVLYSLERTLRVCLSIPSLQCLVLSS